jgi:hypothetical protein
MGRGIRVHDVMEHLALKWSCGDGGCGSKNNDDFRSTPTTIRPHVADTNVVEDVLDIRLFNAGSRVTSWYVAWRREEEAIRPSRKGETVMEERQDVEPADHFEPMRLLCMDVHTYTQIR